MQDPIFYLQLSLAAFIRFLRELITEFVRVFLLEIGQRPRFAANDRRQIVKDFVRFHRGSIR